MKQFSHELRRTVRRVGPEQAFLDALSLVQQLHTEAAVFAVDADRNVVWWSDGAERLLGYGAREMLGAHCLKGNRCPQCMRGCGVEAHGEIVDVPLKMLTAGGDEVDVLKTARSFTSEDGTFLGAIEVLRRASDQAPPPPKRPRWARDVHDFHGLVTGDEGMLQAFQILRNVAETDATVLVRGESGTGKELAARALHLESHRSQGRFQAVNCAALSPTLLESELFGHVKGAFTGAVNDRVGVFEQADGGTLFLDEVAELPLDLQAKLLRVLQERCFVPVGGTRSVKVDIRVVAATHQSLRQAVKEGRFREDLLYRLRVVPIFLPPLRDRRGDVELLMWHFIDQANERGPRRIRRVAPEAMRALLDHPWPGNVRELLNVVQYAFAVGRGPELGCQDLPPEFRERRLEPAPLPTGEPDEAERLRAALRQSRGHVGKAAELLGMSRPTFWRKRKKFGI